MLSSNKGADLPFPTVSGGPMCGARAAPNSVHPLSVVKLMNTTFLSKGSTSHLSSLFVVATNVAAASTVEKRIMNDVDVFFLAVEQRVRRLAE